MRKKRKFYEDYEDVGGVPYSSLIELARGKTKSEDKKQPMTYAEWYWNCMAGYESEREEYIDSLIEKGTSFAAQELADLPTDAISAYLEKLSARSDYDGSYDEGDADDVDNWDDRDSDEDEDESFDEDAEEEQEFYSGQRTEFSDFDGEGMKLQDNDEHGFFRILDDPDYDPHYDDNSRDQEYDAENDFIDGLEIQIDQGLDLEGYEYDYDFGDDFDYGYD